MSRDPPTNVGASVRARLLNLARRRGGRMQDLLVRFGTERLLDRLSRSSYRDHFLLKGAILFAAWAGAPHRATRDADLLGVGDASAMDIAAVFRKVAAMPTDTDDGLVYDLESIKTEEIREDNTYGGVRVTLRASLHGAIIPLQVDLAFGEAVLPPPETVELPSLLDFPPIRLRSYPPEVTIAEKFEAMVKLGLANSRMKDYYDVWYLASHRRFEGERLRQAVRATFERRGTTVPTQPPAGLSDAFAVDPAREAAWRAFLDRAAVPVGERSSLAAAVRVIRPFLMDIARSAASSSDV
ncbi:MAG: nucleotidyl transferase AbiEii/AbiGii toxin family protein [bacterium]